VEQVGPDRVRLSGVKGHARPPTLKALAFFDGGWLGEAEISYAGPNAEARARLAMDILRKRLGGELALRCDLIGVSSIFGDDGNHLLDGLARGAATDVRLRVAARHASQAAIDRLLREVTALWTCGPAGGGGARSSKRQRLSSRACLLPRELVPARFALV
jgi:Acyclic terpene utilisation family protein AtuA